MTADKRSVSPFSLFMRSSSSFPFLALLLLCFLSICRSIPNITLHVRRLFPFQNSNPISQNLILNFKSLFLSFSLSKIPIWIFLHGSCCSGIRLIRHLDLPSRFMLFTVHAVEISIWIFPFKIHVLLWWSFHIFLIFAT
ncbi:hypothetical protein Hanom_Chr10g00938531 [Helianthus anomalus]